MQPSFGVAIVLSCVALGCGSDRHTDADYVGPRQTGFKPDVTFSVFITTPSPGPNTTSRDSPFAANELLNLQQPPVITKLDVSGALLEEAPGQWATVTVHLTPEAAKRFANSVKTTGRDYAVLLNDEVVAVQQLSEQQDGSSIALRESMVIPDLRSVLK